jgi:hypothetical protein
MNIAICLSGSLRNVKKALRSIDFISQTGNTKLFIHTWKFEEERNLLNQRVLPDSISNVEFILNNFKIESILIDKYESKLNLYEEIKKTCSVNLIQFPTLFRYYPMHYSIQEANKLKIKYEKENNFIFDIVYRMRFDSEILNPENLPTIKTNDNVIIIPKNNDYTGINDQFAYGSSTAMDAYSNLFDNFNKLNGNYWNPEQLLLKHLQNQKIEIQRSDLEVDIYKAI